MKKILLVGVIILLAVTLSGCKNTAEKTAESIIESSTGGEVEVDIDNESMIININDGSLVVGEGVGLPSTFPDDVYVIDGEIISSMTIDNNSTYQVQIDTTESYTDAVAMYDEKLQADGWSIISTLEISDGADIMAEKDDRYTTVSIATSEGITVVIITTSVISE